MAYTNNVQKYLKLVASMTLYANNMRDVVSSNNNYIIISCGAKYLGILNVKEGIFQKVETRAILRNRHIICTRSTVQ